MKRLLAIVAIAIGYVLNPLNGSLAVTAYPQLSEYFAVPYASLSAMVMYFMAATAVIQPLAGGIGDFIGRRTIFLLGIVGFTVSSAMAAHAQSFDALLLWRIGQAACSGVIMANGIALIAQVAPQEKIGIYVGWLNSAFVATTVFGFMVGGLILQHFSWPMLFHLNVVLGVIAFVLALSFIPKDSGHKARFTALSFMGVPVLPLALGMQALVQHETPVVYFLLFILALTVLGIAISRSNDSREQLKSFGNLHFMLGCAIILFSIALHFAVMFTLPAWAQAAMGIESGLMGIYFAIIAIAQVVTSPAFGKLVDRNGEAGLRLFAIFALATPMLVMIFHLNKISFALALALFGTGLAATQVIAQRTCLRSSTEQSRALAMGIYSSCRSIGGLSGNALAAVILASYAVITTQAGVDVLEWGLALFVAPVVLALIGLHRQKN